MLDHEEDVLADQRRHGQNCGHLVPVRGCSDCEHLPRIAYIVLGAIAIVLIYAIIQVGSGIINGEIGVGDIVGGIIGLFIALAYLQIRHDAIRSIGRRFK